MTHLCHKPVGGGGPRFRSAAAYRREFITAPAARTMRSQSRQKAWRVKLAASGQSRPQFLPGSDEHGSRARSAETDFVDDLIGASFRVNNPNAKASCGCGTSFAL